jgi:hypothetical protein
VWIMRSSAVATAALVALLIAPAFAGDEFWIGERGTLNNPLEACNSYDDWARFEILRFREFDDDAAIKFLDQHCPTVLTGPVIIEEFKKPPSNLGMSTFGLCLRRVGDPGRCLWLDSGWLVTK